MLKNKGYTNILTVKKKIDLTDQMKTFEFLKKQKPKFIFMLLQKSEAYLQMIDIKLILFTKISKFKIMLFMELLKII